MLFWWRPATHSFGEGFIQERPKNRLQPTGQEGGDAALHNQKFHVVGVLEATGRPEDRAVYVNMEGFFLMNDHATSLLTDEEYEQIIEEKGEAFIDQEFDQRRVPLPLEQRRISAILVASATLGGVNPYAGSIQKEVNKGRLEKSTQWTDYSPPRLQKAASAIFPIAEPDSIADDSECHY